MGHGFAQINTDFKHTIHCKPSQKDNIIDQTIGKLFDYIGIEHDLLNRWGEESKTAEKNDSPLKAVYTQQIRL